MHSTSSKMRASGFTLIELMIVVVIISILAVVGGTAYKRYGSRARSSEVYAMFGEMRTKEEAYRAEFSVYCNTSVTGCPVGVGENTFYPALVAAEPIAKPISIGTEPPTWVTLGVNPGKSSLYCGYNVVAGTPATFAGNAGARGLALLTPPPTGAWWYANATCDMDGSGPTTTNSLFVTGMNTTAVVVTNEGQ